MHTPDQNFPPSPAIAELQAAGYCAADARVLAHLEATGQLLDTTASPAPELAFAPLANKALGVYAVVDSADWVRRMLAAGLRTIQLRMKDASDPSLPSQVAEAIALGRAAPGAQVFINDHWELALALGAYGVHLGQEDLERADMATLQRAGIRLGISTHCYWEVARAVAWRPSYIACGPIFATQSKDMPWIPQGLDNLRYWTAQLDIPVVGIAGINTRNMAQVAAQGVAGAAVISAITQADHPDAVCRQLVAAFDTGSRHLRTDVPRRARPTIGD